MFPQPLDQSGGILESEMAQRISGIPKLEGFLNLMRLILGVGFPVHKPYPYSLYR